MNGSVIMRGLILLTKQSDTTTDNIYNIPIQYLQYINKMKR